MQHLTSFRCLGEFEPKKKCFKKKKKKREKKKKKRALADFAGNGYRTLVSTSILLRLVTKRLTADTE